MKGFWIGAAAIVAMASAPAAAQTVLPNPAGPWVHAASAITFPVSGPDYQRSNIHGFDSTGDDIGVTYRLLDGETVFGITAIYIYPLPAYGCEAEWNHVKSEIDRTGGAILSEGRAPSPSGATADAAYHAEANIGRPRPGDHFSSAVYLYCVPGGKWLVKYFSSWRGTPEQESISVGLLRAVTWPEPFSH